MVPLPVPFDRIGNQAVGIGGQDEIESKRLWLPVARVSAEIDLATAVGADEKLWGLIAAGCERRRARIGVNDINCARRYAAPLAVKLLVSHQGESALVSCRRTENYRCH